MEKNSGKQHRGAGFFILWLVCTLFLTNSVWAQDVSITRLGGFDGSGYYDSVYVKGNYAYCAGGYSGLDIIDISNPASPQKVGTYNTGELAQGVWVDGDYAFVADSDTLEVVNVSDPAAPYLADRLDTGSFTQGVTVRDGYAYVANSWDGLYVVDVRNLPSVSAAGSCDTMYYARNVVVDGNYAYVADDNSGMMIIDVSNPAAPSAVTSVGKNIAVDDLDVNGGYAYLGCYFSGLQVVNVTNPAAPVLTGNYTPGGYMRVGGVQVRDSYAYLAGSTGLEILDVSTPSAPVSVGVLDTPGYPSDVWVDYDYAYVADERGGLQVVNVSDPASPSLTGSYDQSFSFQEMSVAGDYAYLLDGWTGLHVFDISDPSAPVETGNYGPIAFGYDVKTRGSYAYVAHMGGLTVVDASNPAAPASAGSYTQGGGVEQLHLEGDTAFLTASDGLHIVDISTPSAPVLKGKCTVPGMARDVSVNGDYAYVAAQSEGLQVVDVSDPANPTVVGGVDTGNGYRVYADGNHAYVVDPANGLRIVDVTDPADPVVVKYYSIYGGASGVHVDGDYAFVATKSELQVLDVSNPANPVYKTGYAVADRLNSVMVNGSRVLTAGLGGKFHVLNFTDTADSQIALDRDALTFGADTAGHVSASQGFTISNGGEGTLSWLVSPDQSWLSCTPVSGTDSGVVTVSVDTSGLPGNVSGEYEGTITVAAPGADNSPQTVTVTLNVSLAGQTQAPFGTFATPLNHAQVRSSVPFTGWVLDDIGVESVSLYREGADGSLLLYVGDAAFVEGARPDVETAFPGYPGNYRAGWGYMMLTNFLPDGDGTYTIHAVATDTEGNNTTLGKTTIHVDNANAVTPFGAIDSPAQGGTAAGNTYRSQGWALTPMPNAIPTDGSTIRVLVDGREVGTANYNIHREDVASLFPGYANSDGALAYLDMDTTPFADGVHTIVWAVTDDAGNEDGIGSRYFKIQNQGVRGKGSGVREGSGGKGVVRESCSPDLTPVGIKRGFNREAQLIDVSPDDKGIIRIEIAELERLELHLLPDPSLPLTPDPLSLKGFFMVGGGLRPLPAGSSLDAARGVFYWLPGPGFVGDYSLLFVLDGKRNRRIDIHIKPRY